MAEAEIQARIQLAIGSLPGVRVFRNSVGTAWSGEILEQTKDSILLGHPRFTRYGLCPGSADLVGWRSLLVRPEHVGQHVAQLLSIEVKTSRGKARADQENWMLRVSEAGGLAGICRSPEAALALLA